MTTITPLTTTLRPEPAGGGRRAQRRLRSATKAHYGQCETLIGPWKEHTCSLELRPLLFHEAYFWIGVSELKLSGALVEKRAIHDGFVRRHSLVNHQQ